MPNVKSPDTSPRVRDAHTTRERILNIAAKEFSSKGYDGARIDTIVTKSKISKNLVYHYFSGKEALFIEVMERAYAAMRERQNEMALPGRDPITDMRALVLQTIQHFIEHPDFIQLLSTENMHKASHIKKSKKITDMFNPLKRSLSSILDSGMKQGVFRTDTNWIDLYISISGLGSYYLSNRYTLSYVLGVEINTPERAVQRVKHVPDMVISYLCDPTAPRYR